MTDCVSCEEPTTCNKCGNSKVVKIDGKTCVDACGAAEFSEVGKCHKCEDYMPNC